MEIDMPKPKQSFLTDAVKAYLQMWIAKAGPEPKPLESERELCIRFGISRPTVHQAVEEILSEGWCIRIPGKRALYSNPECAIPGTRNIGLLSGNLYSSSFLCLPELSVIFKEFSDMRTFVHFTRLYSTGFEELVRELENMHFNGLLFATVNHKTLPFMKRLIADGIPTVGTVQHYDMKKYNLPAAHFEPFDYAKSLETRAKAVKSLGFKRIVMMSDYQEYFGEFQRASGNLIEPENFFTNIAEIPEKLPRIIKEYKPDLIISDGGAKRYKLFFDTLANYSGTVPDIMVYPVASLSVGFDIEKKYKVHYMDDTKLFEKQGRSIAAKLKYLMDIKEKGKRK